MWQVFLFLSTKLLRQVTFIQRSIRATIRKNIYWSFWQQSQNFEIKVKNLLWENNLNTVLRKKSKFCFEKMWRLVVSSQNATVSIPSELVKLYFRFTFSNMEWNYFSSSTKAQCGDQYKLNPLHRAFCTGYSNRGSWAWNNNCFLHIWTFSRKFNFILKMINNVFFFLYVTLVFLRTFQSIASNFVFYTLKHKTDGLSF